MLHCTEPSSFSSLGDDKVSMFTDTYSHKPWGRLKWSYAVTRLTAHFMCGLVSYMVTCKFRKKVVIHDTECPYWDQVSLKNPNPNLNPSSFQWECIMHLIFAQHRLHNDTIVLKCISNFESLDKYSFWVFATCIYNSISQSISHKCFTCPCELLNFLQCCKFQTTRNTTIQFENQNTYLCDKCTRLPTTGSFS